MPPLLVEVLIGILCGSVAVVVRDILSSVLGDIAPFVFVFLAVALAAIVAGWRSGLVAMVVGQVLTVHLILGEVETYGADSQQQTAAVVVASISQLILLAVIGLYQREVDKGTAEREQRLTLLNEALVEIDHRTRNNYQTVLAMVELQARRADNPDVAAALRQIADRIEAIANASQQLAVRSADLGAVRLDDHLCSLVSHIERGLSHAGIKVECEVDGVTASSDKATSIAIIVNELVTNALKHAFNGERPGNVSVVGRAGSGFELIVADDGRGMNASKRDGHNGLGSQLVKSFVQQLGATHSVSSNDQGTIHRVEIPNLGG